MRRGEQRNDGGDFVVQIGVKHCAFVGEGLQHVDDDKRRPSRRTYPLTEPALGKKFRVVLNCSCRPSHDHRSTRTQLAHC
jgi:hypothetical protein